MKFPAHHMISRILNLRILNLSTYFYYLQGFTVVNYHAKLLLVQARVTEAMDPNLGTILIGLCQMAGNLIGAALIDKVGRKTLLYVSSTFLGELPL